MSDIQHYGVCGITQSLLIRCDFILSQWVPSNKGAPVVKRENVRKPSWRISNQKAYYVDIFKILQYSSTNSTIKIPRQFGLTCKLWGNGTKSELWEFQRGQYDWPILFKNWLNFRLYKLRCCLKHATHLHRVTISSSTTKY